MIERYRYWRLTALLAILILGLAVGPALAQPAGGAGEPGGPAADAPAGEQSFRLPGSEEPLRIKAKYANTEKRDDGQSEVFIASGSVYAWQGDRRNPTLELTCENLVVWRTATGRVNPQTKAPIRRTTFYAERNVRFQRGREVLFGQRMYFDLDNNSALIDRMRYQARLTNQERLIPLVLRGRRFRVLTNKQSLAQDAYFSTSSFGDPSYRFQASNILIDVDQKTGVINTLHSRSVLRLTEPSGPTDVPLWFLPYMPLTLDEDFILKELSIGANDGQFGTYVFTRWGKKIGDWGSWFVDIDVSSERGLGLGPGLKYETEDRYANPYRGELRTYVINDNQFGTGEVEESGDTVPEELRGRLNWEHRHELPKKLTLDLELSVISDRNFLREFFEEELREEKEKETIAYLRKQLDNHQASVLFKYEINDFITTTETLPLVRLDTLSEPVYDKSKTWRNLYYSGSHQLGFLRRQIDETPRTQIVVDEETGEETEEDVGPDPDDGQSGARVSSDNLLAYPFRVGHYGFYPFFGITPGVGQDVDGGSQGTFSARIGLRATTQFAKMYRLRLPALDINNLQHVINPEVRWVSIFATPAAEEKFFYDNLDTVDDLTRIDLKLLNRLKTRRFDQLPRHTSARYPARRKPAEETIAFARERQGSIVEMLFVDVVIPIFPDADNDNRGATFGDMDVDLRYAVRQWWTINSDLEFRLQGRDAATEEEQETDERDPEEGREELVDSEDEDESRARRAGLRVFNVSTTISRWDRRYPRWQLTVGNRFARDVSNSIFIEPRLQMNPKWDIGFELEYETQESRLDRAEFNLRRYFDRFLVEFRIERTEGDQPSDNETTFEFRFLLRALDDEDDNEEEFEDDPVEDEDGQQSSLLGGLGVGTNQDQNGGGGSPGATPGQPRPLEPRSRGGR